MTSSFSGKSVLRKSRFSSKSPSYSDIRFGIKLIGGNIGHENDIYTFPYFCTFLVRYFLRQLPPAPAHMV